MTVHLPEIGITGCERAKSLIEEFPQNIVGSFWVMCGYGFDFDTEEIPDWWINLDSAQDIIDVFEEGYFDGEHNCPVYLGFCIVVIAEPSNPAHLSYVIEHLRMFEYEGIGLLRIMSHYNISTIVELRYPNDFLSHRYPTYKSLTKTLNNWSTDVWEDYCNYLMSIDGQRMFYNYCKKINAVKDEVKATVEKGTKPLVLTEGETDPIYIKTALALLGEKEILAQVDIEWVGISIGKGKSINTGDGGLKNTRDVLLSNPKFLTRKVLLIYDCDTDKSNEDHELLKIRKIPQQKNRKVKKGIENLFPDHLFTEEFYLPKTKYGDYGEENQIQEFQKMKFCKWICEERKQADDFVDFKIIIDFIKDCLGTVIY
jgi:hypothetical protein